MRVVPEQRLIDKILDEIARLRTFGMEPKHIEVTQKEFVLLTDELRRIGLRSPVGRPKWGRHFLYGVEVIIRDH